MLVLPENYAKLNLVSQEKTKRQDCGVLGKHNGGHDHY